MIATTHYDAMPMKQLRRILCDRDLGQAGWRQTARKADVIAAIQANDRGESHLPAAHSTVITPEATPEATPAQPVGGDLSAIIADAISQHLNLTAPLDEGRVREIVAESGMSDDQLTELIHSSIEEHVQPTEIIIKDADDNVIITIDQQHYKYPLLIACARRRIPVMLVGPAGSGKTSVAHATAEALQIGFEGVSFGPMTTKADLFGYKDANGTYHDTALVRTATQGGVFLGDELDASNAGVLTGVNMVLANGHLAIPTGMVEKHDDLVFVGAANTFGTGANRQYVGRNQLDAATLDRLAVIDWPYDESLEAAAVNKHAPGANVDVPPAPSFDIAEGGTITAQEWLTHVQRVRAVVDQLGIRTVISPRASIYGAQLAMDGVGRTHLNDLLIWKGMDSDTKDKIQEAL